MYKRVSIRAASNQDAASIYQFVSELENEQFKYGSFELIYKENIKNPAYAYFVAIMDNKVVGFISYHTQNLLHHCGRVGEIQELYIDKAYRNKGISRLLIEEIDRFSKRNHVKCMEVTSNIKRIENVEIYNKLDFILIHNKLAK